MKEFRTFRFEIFMSAKEKQHCEVYQPQYVALNSQVSLHGKVVWAFSFQSVEHYVKVMVWAQLVPGKLLLFQNGNFNFFSWILSSIIMLMIYPEVSIHQPFVFALHQHLETPIRILKKIMLNYRLVIVFSNRLKNFFFYTFKSHCPKI